MQLWKKALAAVTAGVLCLGSVGISGVQSVLESVRTVLTASADVPGEYDGTYGDLYYKNDDDLVSIVGCKTTAESVEIPAEIDGKPVVACHAKRKKLTRKTKKTLLNTTFKSVFFYL